VATYWDLMSALASRPCGTNARECATVCEVKLSIASGMLCTWEIKGRIFKAKSGDSQCDGAPMNQFFTSERHRDKWLAMPVDARPNLARRRLKSGPRPLRNVASAVPAIAPTHGAYDPRRQLSPGESAELKSTGFYSSGAYRTDPTFSGTKA
jgi:hypothetical protein